MNEFDIELRDMIVTVAVEHYERQAADPHTWDSDWDFTGFVEFDYRCIDENNDPFKPTEAEDVQILAEYERLIAEDAL